MAYSYPMLFKIKIITLFLMFITVAGYSKTYYVSASTGNDRNQGTLDKPFKTISRGAVLALPGDTVYVMEGIYRERVSPARGGAPGNPIVYFAQPGKRVYVRGSELWKPKWQQESKGVFYARPADSLFNDDVYYDSGNPFKVIISSTPWNRNGYAEGIKSVKYTLGQVFVKGEMWKQVPVKDEMLVQDKTWWYDATSGNIYLNATNGTSIPGADVEITTRRRIFAPHQRGLAYIQVIGFIFEHCGNQFTANFWNTRENAQSGAVGLRQGSHWLIKNNIIRYANTLGIDCGKEGPDNERDTRRVNPGVELSTDNVIEHNYLIDNGSNGLASYGSKNLVIKDNVVMYNNNLRFLGYMRYEQAGIKLHGADKTVITNNYVTNNFTQGIWFDNQFPDARITKNVIACNSEYGIFLEMSDYPYNKVIIDNNIIIQNTKNAIYMHDASGSTVINNLLANTPGSLDYLGYGQSVFIRQVGHRTRTYHHSFFNNLQLSSADVFDIDYPSYLGGEERFDGNVYDATPNARAFVINALSDKPVPYRPDSMIVKVLKDINNPALTMAQVARGPYDAQLTFDEWKTFWKAHGELYDQHSILSTVNLAAFNVWTAELKLVIGFDPASVKTYYLPLIKDDFSGNKITEGSNIPGPFQKLKQGTNEIKVWSGLPIIREGELPPLM